MSIEPTLYSALDKKGKEAADAWFKSMAPELEEGAKSWVESRSNFSERETKVYWKIVHPLLLYRFYFHLSFILSGAAEGWSNVYKDGAKEMLQNDRDS